MSKARRAYERFVYELRSGVHATVAIIIVTLLLVLGLFCSSCRSLPQQVVLPNSSNRDSVRIEFVHDSVYVYKHDSIFRDRWRSGDTVYVTVEKWQTRWRDKYNEIHDSVYINQTDTIYQTVTVVQPVNTFLKNSGIALWVIIALAVLAIVAGLFIKFAK